MKLADFGLDGVVAPTTRNNIDNVSSLLSRSFSPALSRSLPLSIPISLNASRERKRMKKMAKGALAWNDPVPLNKSVAKGRLVITRSQKSFFQHDQLT